jgi:hypothetical protein
VKRKITLSAFSILLVIGLSTYAVGQKTSKEQAPTLSKAAHDELDSIQARAKEIAPRLASSDPAEAKKAQAEWDKHTSDLTAWARKYNVKLRTRTFTPEAAVAAGGIGGVGLHKCPPIICPAREPGFCCELISSSPGRCKYRCTPY